MLYRVFPLVLGVGTTEHGGPLHVSRVTQGRSRHDNPRRYGAFYGSRSSLAAIAEWMRRLRGAELTVADLLRVDGSVIALAPVDDAPVPELLTLDDPGTLVERQLRPSSVATRNRKITQGIALSIFEEGADGFEWWSTIEASWINVTLFAERAVPKLGVASEPEHLNLDHPAVREAANALGIRLAA